MANFDKNQTAKIKEEAAAALAAKPKAVAKRHEISIMDVKPGMDILMGTKFVRVKTVRQDACATRGVHVNTTQCYDPIARVVVRPGR